MLCASNRWPALWAVAQVSIGRSGSQWSAEMLRAVSWVTSRSAGRPLGVQPGSQPSAGSEAAWWGWAGGRLVGWPGDRVSVGWAGEAVVGPRRFPAFLLCVLCVQGGGGAFTPHAPEGRDPGPTTNLHRGHAVLCALASLPITVSTCGPTEHLGNGCFPCARR